jgi:hypothetical protein
MTRPAHQVARALELHCAGVNQLQIAQLTGIPRSTIRCWIQPGYLRKTSGRAGCSACDESSPALGADYVYLLGLYLGDGCLSAYPRGVWRLRIFQDARYVGLIDECKRAMGAVTPTRIGTVQCIGCVVGSLWKHWIHLFPQHGPGRKWTREIKLESWQSALTRSYPREFLRGLVHSDGCRSLNTVHRRWATGRASYCYPRYFFSNVSDDIRRMFIDCCDQLGVRWTQANTRNVAISRRQDVVALDRFIGPKY